MHMKERRSVRAGKTQKPTWKIILKLWKNWIGKCVRTITCPGQEKMQKLQGDKTDQKSGDKEKRCEKERGRE